LSRHFFGIAEMLKEGKTSEALNRSMTTQKRIVAICWF